MADDSPEIRSYFASFISHEADMELAGTASSGAEAVQMAGELRPDIILMDIQMETRVAGISASKQILREHPATKIIILTILEDDWGAMEPQEAQDNLQALQGQAPMWD